MIDIKLIEQNPELIQKTAEQKNIKIDIQEFLKLNKNRKEKLQQLEEINAAKNAANTKMKSANPDEKAQIITEMQSLSEEEKSLNEAFKQIDEKFQHQILLMPGIMSDKTPIGKDDSENVEIKTVGELPKFDFEPKDHVELALNLDILDIKRGVKIAGSRNYFLKGDGLRLEMAIMQLTIDTLVSKGFTPFSVPLLVNHDAMVGTSYFPGGEEQAYTIEKDEKYLIGTSEVSITSYHQNEILEESELPKLYCGISPCFRREAGTYGKDTHGLYRVHQFTKVEQVVICKNDPAESEKMHNLILSNAEEILQKLKLPYRVVAVCSGDMGQGQFYKNDIETWMPSRNAYGETHSCSTFHDFQARRLNLRYKNSDNKNIICHTLNNTCVASPRILIPILESYQNSDGSITIPEVLRPYMQGQEKIIKK
jgi:seryl-tRNA synthetase